jgi:hypothetical protein
MKCQHEKMPKKPKKKLGLNGTEPGVKFNIIFLCNGLIIFIKKCTGEKEIHFPFSSLFIYFIK